LREKTYASLLSHSDSLASSLIQWIKVLCQFVRDTCNPVDYKGTTLGDGTLVLGLHLKKKRKDGGQDGKKGREEALL